MTLVQFRREIAKTLEDKYDVVKKLRENFTERMKPDDFVYLEYCFILNINLLFFFKQNDFLEYIDKAFLQIFVCEKDR